MVTNLARNTEAREDYFSWMCDLVCDSRHKYKNYSLLLNYLDETDFYYTIPLDGNRAEDGIDLRYRYGYQNNVPDSYIATYIDDRQCSMLEMMVALAVRMEEHIMYDPDVGDRTAKWFWIMIGNLGLACMTDRRFDEDYVEQILTEFMEHDYSPDGHGGLFAIDNCDRDLRDVEIWCQMCWYLADVEGS